ncbi:MAG: AAA family ATPase [Myxococcota bacterium]|nr:AAA family ATPase [Myxococcota bacterium]
MKAVDIPQADSLARIRELVQTVKFGAVDTARIQRVMTLHPRHVGYHLHAGRVLNWLVKETGGWMVTPLGEQVLATSEGSQEERAVFRTSISESIYLKKVAPDLLADDEPEQDLLSQAIQDVAGIAPATARRRASTLLRWRTQSLPSRVRRFELSLDDDEENDGQRPSIAVHAVHVERYGPLRSMRLELAEAAVLIGDNASGKSTFFDVFSFIRDALTDGVPAALAARSHDWRDLLWFGEGQSFAFAVEFNIPKALRYDHARARYELEIGQTEDESVGIRRESLFLSPREAPPATAIHEATPRGWRKVLSLGQAGQARYGSEHPSSRKVTTAPVGTKTLALSQLPDDVERFPTAGRIRALFQHGIQRLALSGDAIRAACPAEGRATLGADGSGLPRVVRHLMDGSKDIYDAWLAHAAEVVEGIEGVRVQEDEGQLSLRFIMRGGFEVPMQRLADGALRALALSAVPYQDVTETLVLLEAPESGIHPKGIAPLSQALAVETGVQVCLTTYSSAWVAAVQPSRLRCFVRDAGSIRMVVGNQLELLSDPEKIDMPVVYAAGMLG